jgi:hypothetical protein
MNGCNDGTSTPEHRVYGEGINLVQFDFLSEELTVGFVASCFTEDSILESIFHWYKFHVRVVDGLELILSNKCFSNRIMRRIVVWVGGVFTGEIGLCKFNLLFSGKGVSFTSSLLVLDHSSVSDSCLSVF